MSTSQILTVHQVADLVGVHPETIKRWCRTHKFVQPVTVVGQHWRFRAADVSAWIKGANDLEHAMRELVAALHSVSHDPAETPQGRKWATARLAELGTGDPQALHAIQRVASKI